MIDSGSHALRYRSFNLCMVHIPNIRLDFDSSSFYQPYSLPCEIFDDDTVFSFLLGFCATETSLRFSDSFVSPFSTPFLMLSNTTGHSILSIATLPMNIPDDAWATNNYHDQSSDDKLFLRQPISFVTSMTLIRPTRPRLRRLNGPFFLTSDTSPHALRSSKDASSLA
ncbi:hypothetical protein N7528_004850 [Penicillium herquei]|nr:hypothetical protein N7528_004850 [Penicillium herquei]